jgi:hypothetical protein
VQHGPAREVAAAADQREPVAEVARLALPQLDRRVRPHDPLAVVGVQEHRAVEAVRPLDHAGVVVRVRDRDRGQAAVALDLSGRVVIEQRHAVPQDVAVAGRHEQRALPDRERRVEPDAVVRALATDLVAVAGAQVVAGPPRLPRGGHVLALVLADRAAFGRRVGRCELRAAGRTEVSGHSRR